MKESASMGGLTLLRYSLTTSITTIQQPLAYKASYKAYSIPWQCKPTIFK